jgi:hypothetical protein
MLKFLLIVVRYCFRDTVTPLDRLPNVDRFTLNNLAVAVIRAPGLSFRYLKASSMVVVVKISSIKEKRWQILWACIPWPVHTVGPSSSSI